MAIQNDFWRSKGKYWWIKHEKEINVGAELGKGGGSPKEKGCEKNII